MKQWYLIGWIMAMCCGTYAQALRTTASLSALFPQNVQDPVGNLRTHTGILPAIRQESTDSLSPLQRKKINRFNLMVYPDFAAQYDTSLFYRAAAGLSFEGRFKDKWYARAAFSAGWSRREGVNQTHPFCLPLHNRPAFIYTDLRARIAYTPNNYFHVAAGIDNQFFGEGYRSLLQGDQVAPNPFALMRVNVWRLEYGLLYQFFHDNDTASRMWKFGATHYLSYNVTRSWNITFFETVLFQPKDGNFNRAFEVEYLNPIVFFRPQEYSIGSSDNVLLGVQTSVKFKKQTIYGQFLLDEFLLKEIKARSRWWANKYGAQLGIKGHLGSWTYRFEGSFVRPYTYAHINDGQNGGNLGLPVAHPLGSNFAELLVQAERSLFQRFRLRGYAAFQLKGYDTDALSWGGDVYQSYQLRPKEYGHTIGQGMTVRTVRAGCEMRYKIGGTDLVFYIDPQLIVQWGESGNQLTGLITAGWRSQLFQERKPF